MKTRRFHHALGKNGVAALLITAPVVGALMSLFLCDLRPGTHGLRPEIMDALVYRLASLSLAFIPFDLLAEQLVGVWEKLSAVRAESWRMGVTPIDLRGSPLLNYWGKYFFLGALCGLLAAFAVLLLFPLWAFVSRLKAVAIRRLGLSDGLQIGSYWWGSANHRLNLLLAGSMGVGKSVLVSTLIGMIRRWKQSCVLIDYQAEAFTRFYREGTDSLLSLGDARSLKYSPLAEIEDEEDCELIASVFFSKDAVTDPQTRQWVSHAQDFFEVLLRECFRQHKNGKARVTNQTLRELLSEASRQALEQIMESGDPAKALLAEGNEKFLGSVRGVAAEGMSLLRALDPGAGFSSFSVRQWVRERERKSAFLYVVVREKRKDQAFRLGALVAAIALSEKIERAKKGVKLWILLDEFGRLPAQAQIRNALSVGRKYGVATVAAIQNLGQVQAQWGREGSEEVLEGFGAKVFFRSQEPTHQRWVKDLAGETWESQVSTTQSQSRGSSPSISRSKQTSEALKAVLTTAEIRKLKMRECFVFPANGGDLVRTRISRKWFPIFSRRPAFVREETSGVPSVGRRGSFKVRERSRTGWIDPDEIVQTSIGERLLGEPAISDDDDSRD